ncbi:uncharacterized protein K460DRAFT_92332 [Cucurbitaria berberidis CBS 394.84]|uniref:F-box domain-containing protein n=1 Tax=Cucurbitaria berberidis CBS 394.84 TaxID=1168544 RepID=A0A9P4GN56_9PLEO|nr:uncharacterized protein K460DRAFT_92332 [Cucurbitaria berberidis CBS 394.84]KAF1849523.1 hypothetical protein K460DRAFT_92332 [Cucurbitaria berberidis CBS 394.84]
MISVEEPDSCDAPATWADAHARNSTSLHGKLKVLSLSAARAFKGSKRTNQNNSSNISLLMVSKTTVLDLPVELILSICDFLSLDNRACLALACHQLYHYIGTRTFTNLDYNNTRLEKAAVLQKLQKDHPNPKLWICYGCLRFHSTAQRYDPSNFRAVTGAKARVGFPNCKSTYARALDDIYSRLRRPRGEWTAQETWMEDDITSPVRMNVYIACLASSTELIMRQRYHIDCRPKRAGLLSLSSLTVAQLLCTLGMSNLEICPHICFAQGHRTGDGSIMNSLKECEERDYWRERNQDPMFQCAECRLEVEVQFLQMNAMVAVNVWQHVGRLAYTTDQDNSCHTRTMLPMKELEPVEQTHSKSLPPLPMSPRSTSRTNPLLRLPKLSKSWTKVLESLMKRKTATAMTAPDVEPAPALLQRSSSLGEVKRQWKSLEYAAVMPSSEMSVVLEATSLPIPESRK